MFQAGCSRSGSEDVMSESIGCIKAQLTEQPLSGPQPPGPLRRSMKRPDLRWRKWQSLQIRKRYMSVCHHASIDSFLLHLKSHDRIQIAAIASQPIYSPDMSR